MSEPTSNRPKSPQEYFPKPVSVPSSQNDASIGATFGETPEQADKTRQLNQRLRELYAPYTAILPDYHTKGDPKYEFWKGDPGTGFKCHLNVTPDNVLSVSEFLKSHGYHHKYLSGGDVEDGKIFTVYLGGKNQSERIVREISDGIGDLLSEPMANVLKYEALYAPKIPGRFVMENERFKYAAIDGIPIHESMVKTAVGGPANLAYSPGAIDDAKQRLTVKYGDYFGGGIAYYEPSKSGLETYFKK